MPEHVDVEHTLKRIRLFLEEGQYDRALAELENVQIENEDQQREKDYLFGWYLIQRKRWSEAEQYLLPLAHQYESKEDYTGHEEDSTRARRARYLLLLGKVAVNLSRFEDASRHYRKCLKLFSSKHLDLPRVQLKARYGLGMICIMNGLYSEAIIHYNEALLLAEADENNEDLPNIYYGLCDAYRQMGKFDQAYEYGIRALHIYTRRRSARRMEGSIRTLLGRLCYQQGSLREASDHYTEALSIATIDDSPILALVSFIGLADVRLAEQRFEEARRYCERAHSMIERAKNQHYAGMMYLVAGKIAQEEAQYTEGEKRQELLEEAIDWFEEANSCLSSTQARTTKSETHGRWAQALEQLGRGHEALNHWKSAYQVISPVDESQ